MPAHIESNEQQIKKHIIEIMTLVKKRLHIHGIKIGTGKEELPIEFASVKSLTLVERIQKRGCAVSSNRFADIFTSRPNRMVATTIEELVFTYETILELDLQILSANELLELCHLTRLPIAHISRFAKYFADDEWRTADLGFPQKPVSKESFYYQKKFAEYFTAKHSTVIPRYWLPEWSGDTNEPSARTLHAYKNKKLTTPKTE